MIFTVKSVNHRALDVHLHIPADLDIYENDELDEKLLASWIRQASELPGEKMF